MATSVATGALRPKVAVAISAVLNLIGAFLSTAVAKTISSGLVDETKINPTVIFAGLIGAILWNLTTWYLGLPSSSSHALFGGLIGATWVAAGGGAIKFMGLITAVVLPALAAPVVAGLAAMIATYFAYKITAILISSHLGFALSTTLASGSIFGAGAGKRPADVRWSVAGKMVRARWVRCSWSATPGGPARPPRWRCLFRDLLPGGGLRDLSDRGLSLRSGVIEQVRRQRDRLPAHVA
jgi:phosphate/sulfate permease